MPEFSEVDVRFLIYLGKDISSLSSSEKKEREKEEKRVREMEREKDGRG